MKKRFYEDLPIADTAVAIFKDIIYDGSSSGWEVANVVSAADVKKYLEPYNIHYVGDGIWRYDRTEKESPHRFEVGQIVYYFDRDGSVCRDFVEGIEIDSFGIHYHVHKTFNVKTEDELFEDPAVLYDVKISKIKDRIDALEKEMRKVEEAKQAAIDMDTERQEKHG